MLALAAKRAIAGAEALRAFVGGLVRLSINCFLGVNLAAGVRYERVAGDKFA